MSTGGATDPKRRRVTAHARQTDPVTVPVDPVDAVAVGLVPELGARDGASARAPHATATGSLSPHTCRVEGAAAPTPNVRTTASSASTRNGGGGGEAECPPTVTVTVAQALRHRGSPPATATANPTARHSHASACDGVTVPLPAADPGGHIERVPAASTRRVEKTCTPSFEPTHAHRHTGPVAAGSTIIAPASGSHPVETHASVQPPPDTGIDEPTCAPCCEHTPPLGGRAPPSEKVLAIAAAFRRADRVLILAGAGFSAGSCCADGSRLPDYRSTNSFATAYAPLAERGLNYRTIATPAFFSRDPSTAWGFYASRMKMYNEAVPHKGYDILRELIGPKSHFVVTSNVDGFFPKAGFAAECVCEIHGSLGRVQCSKHEAHGTWRSSKTLRGLTVNPLTFKVGTVPQCQAARCGEIARPNVLLFGDQTFARKPTNTQRARYTSWMEECVANQASVLILELGAGSVVTTIRDIFSSSYLDMVGNGCAVDAVRVNTAPGATDGPFCGDTARYHRVELDARSTLTAVHAAMGP
eukprot:m.38974 g.38974  ORF g.38974 m.38974 type:complete len:529 (-) comp13546_c0_seq3:189-1775(-)